MIKRNLFIVARGNSSAYLSYDPVTGNTKRKIVKDQEIQTENAQAYVASLALFTEMLHAIILSPAMMASSMTTIHILNDTAIKYYEARKVLKGFVKDAADPAEEETTAAADAFVASIEERSNIPLTEEQKSLYRLLVLYTAVTMRVISVKKISDIRYMNNGVFGKNMRKLESMAWDLLPMPEAVASAPAAAAVEEIPF